MLVSMKNLLSVHGGAIFLAMMILPGCGGSGGTCGNTAACGGDIAGTWTITSSCVSGTVTSTSCPGETVDTANLNISGTVTYATDMTYTVNSILSGSEILMLPLSCVNKPGATTPPMTCDQLTGTLMGTISRSITCTGSSVCTCNVVISSQTSMTTGTYTTTTAGLLTETPMGGSPSQNDYCVKGKTFTLSPHAAAAMMGQSVSGTITLTKS
jgi:hypothetical protein